MATTSSYQLPYHIGLGLHPPPDNDISYFSLRSDQAAHCPQSSLPSANCGSVPPSPRTIPPRDRFQTTVDSDSDSDSDSDTTPSTDSTETIVDPSLGTPSDKINDGSTSRGFPTKLASSPPTYPTYPHTSAASRDKSNKSSHPHSCYVKQNNGLSGAPYPHTNTLTPPSSAESSPKQRPTVHFSTRPPVVLHHRSNSSSSQGEPLSSQYGASARDGYAPPLSVVDRQWGTLFTDGAEPTRRLGSVLRGLANYMIREYEPRCSLVVPPVKMAAFYNKYTVDKEHFPFQGIFDYQSRHCLRNLELLYQDLSCEYHLIQDHHRSTRPYIPALTPAGLQTWLTTFIQASPDHESTRLQKVILDNPLEADHQGQIQAERLPKQLSRRLFPQHRSDHMYRNIVCALEDWNKRMGASSEPTSPSSSWSSILHDAFRGTSQINSPTARREKSYTDDQRRYHTRKAEDVTISPANTSRHRQRYQSEERREKDDPSGLRYFPSTTSEPVRRRYSDESPERIKHGGHASRRRDKSPKAQRALSTGSAGRQGRQDYSPRHYFRSPYSRGSEEGDSGTASAGRADSYKFFQGRAKGPTYDEFLRGRARR